MSVLVLQDLDVLLHRGTTVEDRGLDLGHVLAETSVFVLDLVGQLAGMAHDQDRGLARDRLDLLERGEDEDGGLAQTGLGLAEDVGAKNGLRDADLLDYGHEARRMLDSVRSLNNA